MGGDTHVAATPVDNTELFKFMEMRDERNNKLYAERQDQIMAMEKERLDLERASRLAIQREEADTLAQAQAMEDLAQEEAFGLAEAQEDDVDNIITGFYGSLYRPE
jgi:hypothetical protein